MVSSAMSKLFWETVKAFLEGYGHLIKHFKWELMSERARLYVECIKLKDPRLEKCVGFVDCTKIRMYRPVV